LPGNTLIITGIKDENKYSALIKSGAEVLYLPSPSGRLDLRRVMQILAQREINEVLLEAGPTLSGAMLQAGLIDQLTIYIAPILMGDGARGLFHLPGLESMDQRVNLEIIDQRMVGGDWRITARVYESLNEE
jgi:diaminohydroxyphosphoribosylaminopyrimidine deaminase/5-amino-6-(5-phosphoribosylamino)uracil reductase